LDEKIGGSFHLALGRGYPETGNHNESSIHWDLICDLRDDSEILLDHELVYKNGKFVL
jgi:aminopeptidase